jgi:hypothetical protein
MCDLLTIFSTGPYAVLDFVLDSPGLAVAIASGVAIAIVLLV